MAIHRTNKKDGNFTQIDNTFINNPKLSAKAKAIHMYVLSKPDDWKVKVTDIVKHFKDGKKSISSGIKELMDQRYWFREQLRTKGEKLMVTIMIYMKNLKMKNLKSRPRCQKRTTVFRTTGKGILLIIS